MPKDSPSAVSMSDIARQAGVSESTVSRALNNSSLISQKTRDRIQGIARDLNYKINESARNLRLQQSRTISVVINSELEGGQSFSDPFMMDMIGAIADELSRHQYDLLFSSRIIASQDWHAYLLDARRADGVIVIGQGKDDQPLRDLQLRGDPVVVWGCARPGAEYCTVGSDNILGGRLATEHLIELGRQRIVFLGDIEHAEIEDRFQGYLQALQGAHMETTERHIKAAFSIPSGYALVRELIEHEIDFDAVFAASDNIAMGAIQALQEHGRQVPVDVSVVGFDDVPVAGFFNPPLTTIRQPIHAGGELMVSKMMARLKGELVESEVLEPQLVVRASCGADPDYTPLQGLNPS
ncbi:LacI family transcriptional regulator [Pseudomaricurvus alkylphenolicus]|jgi:DNA-binding LacI/PurR family transcriptional regulator|uniref:LacI family DNA-binding transcriptional regulator n=1 Tax=Pseudomaricurvus alkylphenolicus TaxID=1306991 RepID=UPI0014222602|nr:LacI family DNA-binding transcriptional regulator [Pseudomaricurvus alkylphenolicus]NIB40893.1 LacI family transcriptional regulator [Pseudomaricurvus alkylphenolicus]